MTELELKVGKKLEYFLITNDLDCLERDMLEDIFDESELEISDETGWHGIEAIWFDDEEKVFYAAYSDQEGDCDCDYLYLSDKELNRLYNWLNLPF